MECYLQPMENKLALVDQDTEMIDRTVLIAEAKVEGLMVVEVAGHPHGEVVLRHQPEREPWRKGLS